MGEGQVGVDRIRTVYSPSPSSPPTKGGEISGVSSKKVRRKFLD
jgi:hypothetical protein